MLCCAVLWRCEQLEMNADVIRYGLELLASYSAAARDRKESIQKELMALIQAKAVCPVLCCAELWLN